MLKNSDCIEGGVAKQPIRPESRHIRLIGSDLSLLVSSTAGTQPCLPKNCGARFVGPLQFCTLNVFPWQPLP